MVRMVRNNMFVPTQQWLVLVVQWLAHHQLPSPQIAGIGSSDPSVDWAVIENGWTDEWMDNGPKGKVATCVSLCNKRAPWFWKILKNIFYALHSSHTGGMHRGEITFFPLKSIEKCLLKHMVVRIYFFRGTLIKVCCHPHQFMAVTWKSGVVLPNCKLNLQEWVTIMRLSEVWTGVGVRQQKRFCRFSRSAVPSTHVHMQCTKGSMQHSHWRRSSVSDCVARELDSLLGVFIPLSVSLSIFSEDSHLYSSSLLQDAAA